MSFKHQVTFPLIHVCRSLVDVVEHLIVVWVVSWAMKMAYWRAAQPEPQIELDSALRLVHSSNTYS